MLHLDMYLIEQILTRLRLAWALTSANQIIIPNSYMGKPVKGAVKYNVLEGQPATILNGV